MSSIRKESLDYSSSSSFREGPTAEEATPAARALSGCGRGNSYAAACAYPPTSPNRTVFLTVRAVAIVLAVVEVVLAIVAQRVIHRPNWMSPILSPAITVWWPSGLDIFFVIRQNRRSHPLSRWLYDGAIGIGFAVAAGFLVAFTLPDLVGSREDSTPATAFVGGAMLFTMFSSA